MPMLCCLKSELLTTATSLLLLMEDTKRWFDGYAVMFMRSEPKLVDLQRTVHSVGRESSHVELK